MSPIEQSSNIRLLLVNEQVLMRVALRLLIESWPGVQVVGEAASAREAMETALRLQPDIVLLDVQLRNGLDGLESIRELAAAASPARIMLLTSTQDQRIHMTAMRSGVVGLVHKEKAASELQKAIRKVHDGEAWLDRTLAARVIMEMSRSTEKSRRRRSEEDILSLTDREREIAALLCEGLKNREIGNRLFICEATVRHHLSSIFTKLGVSNRFELMVFLYRNKFIELPA